MPNSYKVDDVTVKRGLVSSVDLYTWLRSYMDGTPGVRRVEITMHVHGGT